MTQCLAKIKGSSVNILTRVIMNHGGLWDVRISVTLPGTYTGMKIHPTVIGLRASVGGSAASSDWLGVLGPADGPPGGIWIGFITCTVQHEQSIVAVTVTGSLDFLTLANRRDADSIYRPSTLPEYCDTAWNWPLLCRTDSIAMDAAGFSMVDNRAAVTFGVELYVLCDAPGDVDGVVAAKVPYVAFRKTYLSQLVPQCCHCLRLSLARRDRRSLVVRRWRSRRRLWTVITDRLDVRSLADAYHGSGRHPHELHPA